MTQLPHSPFLECLRQAATRAGVLDGAVFQLRPGLLTVRLDGRSPRVWVEIPVTADQAGQVVGSKSVAREWVMYLDNLVRKQLRAASDEAKDV